MKGVDFMPEIYIKVELVKLCQQYSMVFYGYQNCALYNKDIERLCHK